MSERLPEVRYSFALENAGDANWRATKFDLVEGLFELYELTVRLVSDDLEVEVDDLLGATAELVIERGDVPRYITGVVSRVEFLGIEHEQFNVMLKVVPALWGLTKRKNSRHWQEMTVPEILSAVLTAPLAEYGRTMRLDLHSSYFPREFCAQYQEYDYDFARRLMAEEGLYFYFDCSAGGGEVLVLADSNDVLPELLLAEEGATVSVCKADPLFVHEETVQSFHWNRRLDSTAVVQRDFDWSAPTSPPNDELREPDARGFERECYEPGERRYGEADTGTLSKLKLGSLVARGTVGSGEGNIVGFAPGHHFALEDHEIPEVVTEHLITKVRHEGTWLGAQGKASLTGTTYNNAFETIPFDVTYRPLRASTRSYVHGPQTAVVTGAGGEEIHVDEHGRIKIALVWDRLSAADDTSSCWVRVAQLSAGAGWGTMFIPRVGMEVVVEFLDGNPDRPIVTGCVYNADNPAPYALPAEKTKSTIKTNSSSGGGGSNEVRFEDAAGGEELYLHAQKDLTIATGNDKNQTTANNESSDIGSSRTKSTGADETEAIGANKSIGVGANHVETISANRTLSVGASETCSIGASQTVTIGGVASESVGLLKATTVGAAYALSVGGAISTTVDGGLTEKIGAARIVTVGAVSSESVEEAKKVKAATMKFKAKKSYGVSAGTNYKATAKTDVTIKSTKGMGVSSGDDLEVKCDKSATITIKDELTFICGKASLTLQKDGSVIINGKKIKVTAKSKLKLIGKKVHQN